MPDMSPLTVFFREKIIFCLFWQKGNIIFVTFIHIYRKYHVSLYFVRKIIVHFPSKEKISNFRKKGNTVFPHIILFQCHIIPGHIPVSFFWKDHIFTIFEENIIFPCICFRKIIFHFTCKD